MTCPYCCETIKAKHVVLWILYWPVRVWNNTSLAGELACRWAMRKQKKESKP